VVGVPVFAWLWLVCSSAIFVLVVRECEESEQVVRCVLLNPISW
jgi:hypothetical protein